jgi:hypothetical protein
MAYRVKAAYVTVRLARDGAEQVQGYYAGAILPSFAVQENVELLVRKGLVEPVEDVDLPDEADDADEDQGGSEGEGTGTGDDVPPVPLARPAANGSKADWLAYALSQRAEGVSEDDVRAELEPLTKAELIARFPTS